MKLGCCQVCVLSGVCAQPKIVSEAKEASPMSVPEYLKQRDTVSSLEDCAMSVSGVTFSKLSLISYQ